MPSLLRRIDTHAIRLIKKAFSDRLSAQNQNLIPVFYDEGDEDNFNRKIGVLLQAVRKEARLSQHEMAESLNITESLLNSIETGNSGITLILLLNICHQLQIQPIDFLIMVSPNYVSDCQEKSYCISNIIKQLRTCSIEVLKGTELLLSLPQKPMQ